MGVLCVAFSPSLLSQNLVRKPLASPTLLSSSSPSSSSSSSCSHFPFRSHQRHNHRCFIPAPATAPTPALPLRRMSPLLSLSSEASPPALHIEDLVEKDWSFLEADPAAADQESRQASKAQRIIAAAEIEEKSRVLVSFASAVFVDRLVEACRLCELLLVIHDSLLALALIKEQYDGVRCWQGPVTEVPEKFSPFDVVFVCYFPGMAITVDELFRSLAARCMPGARVIITFDQGREVIEKVHRQQYPDMVNADLPDKLILEKAAAERSFRLAEFVDDSDFYLAVLKLCEPGTVE